MPDHDHMDTQNYTRFGWLIQILIAMAGYLIGMVLWQFFMSWWRASQGW